MVSKTLDIRQRRAGIPERQETSEMSPKVLQPGELPAKGSAEKEEPRGVGRQIFFTVLQAYLLRAHFFIMIQYLSCYLFIYFGGTGSLFQKNIYQFSVSKQLHCYFSFSQSSL